MSTSKNQEVRPKGPEAELQGAEGRSVTWHSDQLQGPCRTCGPHFLSSQTQPGHDPQCPGPRLVAILAGAAQAQPCLEGLIVRRRLALGVGSLGPKQVPDTLTIFSKQKTRWQKAPVTPAQCGLTSSTKQKNSYIFVKLGILVTFRQKHLIGWNLHLSQLCCLEHTTHGHSHQVPHRASHHHHDTYFLPSSNSAAKDGWGSQAEN
jgi:hypothetical protein